MFEVRTIGSRKSKVNKSMPIVVEGFPKFYQDNTSNDPWCMLLVVKNGYPIAESCLKSPPPYLERFRWK